MNLARVRAHIREFGLPAIAVAASRRFARNLRHHARAGVGHDARTFTYHGAVLPEFHHASGRTWLTERAVEVAVAKRFLEDRPAGARGLEVGNVMSRYVPVTHRIVDKYETAAGIENIDVVDIATDVPFDFILTISTLEHVGWDEPDLDVRKAERAIAHLRSLLAPGGTLLVTIPLGYHPALDTLALGGWDAPLRQTIVARHRGGPWAERLPTGRRPRYEHEMRFANMVWIAEFGPPDAAPATA